MTDTLTADYGGWIYYTVLAESPERFAVRDSWESSEHRWVTAPQMSALPLHPGFAASLPEVRRAVEE